MSIPPPDSAPELPFAAVTEPFGKLLDDLPHHAHLLPDSSDLMWSELQEELRDAPMLPLALLMAIRLAGKDEVARVLEQAVEDAEVVRIVRERAGAETEPLAHVALRLGIVLPEASQLEPQAGMRVKVLFGGREATGAVIGKTITDRYAVELEIEGAGEPIITSYALDELILMGS